MFPRSTILRRYGHQSLRVSIVRRHPSLSKQAQWGFHNAPRHSQFSRLSPAALLILSSRAAAAQLHNMAWSCGETHHRPQSLQQLQAPGARCRPPGARNTMQMSSAEALYWNSGTSSTTSSEDALGALSVPPLWLFPMQSNLPLVPELEHPFESVRASCVASICPNS